MARLKLKSVVRDFVLDWRSDDDPDAEVEVTIKQASTGENIRINELFSEQTQIWDDAAFGQVQLKRKWNPEALKRYRVYLTLCGCNLTDEEGNDLFRFRNTKRGPELAMGQNEFFEIWDALEPALTAEIHQRVLEMNPQWDWSRMGE